MSIVENLIKNNEENYKSLLNKCSQYINGNIARIIIDYTLKTVGQICLEIYQFYNNAQTEWLDSESKQDIYTRISKFNNKCSINCIYFSDISLIKKPYSFWSSSLLGPSIYFANFYPEDYMYTEVDSNYIANLKSITEKMYFNNICITKDYEEEDSKYSITHIKINNGALILLLDKIKCFDLKLPTVNCQYVAQSLFDPNVIGRLKNRALKISQEFQKNGSVYSRYKNQLTQKWNELLALIIQLPVTAKIYCDFYQSYDCDNYNRLTIYIIPAECTNNNVLTIKLAI